MKINKSVSNRVLAAFFDKNWARRRLTGGYVEYVATSNNSTVRLVVSGTRNQRLTFTKGRRIFVFANTFHFPPHERVFL